MRKSESESMSITEAKRLCRARHGRLPRLGYEMVAREVRDRDDRLVSTTYLTHEGAGYRVWTWTAP